jgi:hypothetical protein
VITKPCGRVKALNYDRMSEVFGSDHHMNPNTSNTIWIECMRDEMLNISTGTGCPDTGICQCRARSYVSESTVDNHKFPKSINHLCSVRQNFMPMNLDHVKMLNLDTDVRKSHWHYTRHVE